VFTCALVNETLFIAEAFAIFVRVAGTALGFWVCIALIVLGFIPGKILANTEGSVNEAKLLLAKYDAASDFC